MGKSTISMAMFNSYVKLPEGKYLNTMNPHVSNCSFGPFLGYSNCYLGVTASHRPVITTQDLEWCEMAKRSMKQTAAGQPRGITIV